MWLSANKVSLRSRAGFTLLELVVASVITAIIAGALVVLSNGAASVWRSGSGNLSMDNRAYTILSQIEQDINGLILYSKLNKGTDAGARGSLHIQIRNTGMPNSWQGPSSDDMRPGSSLDISGNDVSQWRFGNYSTDFRLLTRATDGNDNKRLMGMEIWTPSNLPTVVGYQVVRHADVPGDDFAGMPEVYYRLYRSVVRPAPVSQAVAQAMATLVGQSVAELAELPGVNGTDVEHPNYSGIPPAGDPFAPGTLEYPHHNMVLAEGVVDFGIVLYGRDYDSSDPGESEIYPSGGSLDTKNLPRLDPDIGYIMVFVRLINEQGAKELSRKELDGRGADWWDIVGRNSKVYTRLIPVPKEALNSM